MVGKYFGPVKKRVVSTIFISMLILASMVLVSSISSAQGACNLATTQVCGQTNILGSVGYGAVELCGTCAACGAADGICPEYYTDGSAETKPYKMVMNMRMGTADRPDFHLVPGSDPFLYLYDTGNLACGAIGGSCVNLESKDFENDTWVTDGDVDCFENVKNNNARHRHYFRAVCESVNKTSGCENCPDPDCTATIRGIAYDNATMTGVQDVLVDLVPMNGNSPLERNTTSGVNGWFTLPAFMGFSMLRCFTSGYAPTYKPVYVQRGDNIIDCPLSTATCTPQCTLPDFTGVQICRAQCDATNSCYGGNAQLMSLCDGLPLGTFVPIRRINSTHVEGVTCCTGPYRNMTRPLFNLKGDNIKNLITKNFRKEYNGLPVTLKIIIYEKN